MSRVLRKSDERTQQELAQKKARSIAFKSNLNGTISELSLMRQSLLFAEVSLAAYLSPKECSIAANKIGFPEVAFFNCDGSQAYCLSNEDDVVVVFRGNESTPWSNFRSDAKAFTAVAETVGKVHRGFKKQVDDLWPYIEESLEENTKSIWFVGHSIGGALATISAGRCLLSHIKCEPQAVFTFGSPRVGDKRYVNYTDIPHYRWVNNNDFVPRLPPALAGYRHRGTELYLDRKGFLKDIQGWRRVSDRFQGFLKELLTTFRIDQLSDHAIADYVDRIHNICRSGNQNYNGTGVTESSDATKSDVNASSESS